MTYEVIQPEGLAPGRGYSNGILAAAGGRLLFAAGQIGWDAACKLVSNDFTAQFAQALDNALAIVRAAGGQPEHVCRLTVYVADRAEYMAASKAVGAAYRARMGKHYPAMSLVEVAALLEPGARVEIEATAVIPPEAR